MFGQEISHPVLSRRLHTCFKEASNTRTLGAIPSQRAVTCVTRVPHHVEEEVKTSGTEGKTKHKNERVLCFSLWRACEIYDGDREISTLVLVAISGCVQRIRQCCSKVIASRSRSTKCSDV